MKASRDIATLKMRSGSQNCWIPPAFAGSFQETFEISTDELADTKGPLACTYCRVLRSCVLDRIAGKYGVTKLAVGDTLDEGAATVLKNILLGSPEKIVGSRQVTRKKFP